MLDTIVIVDDEPENIEFLLKVCKEYNVYSFTDPHEACTFIGENPQIDLLITDQKMPGMTGIELVQVVNSGEKAILSIIISAYTDPADLIKAVNSQLIYKYVVKPYNPGKFRLLINEALTMSPIRKAQSFIMASDKNSDDPFNAFLTINSDVEELVERARFFAQSDTPLFIHGETGTGKEVLARAMHACSSRRKGPFVAVNCAALSKELFLSEMFGYKKGAFSGAAGNKKGFVHQAEGGTLFLDEVSEIAIEHQASLLRFIQFSTFYPVGSPEEETVDVRIISASHLHLKELQLNGKFREDLYYRLSAFDLFIPPMRDRKDDIALLLLYYFESNGITSSMVDSDVWKILLIYEWKGNVRQIIHASEKISILIKLYKSTRLTTQILMEVIDYSLPAETIEDIPGSKELLSNTKKLINNAEEPVQPIDLAAHIESFEKEYIKKYMTAYQNNISRTADALGLSRQGLKNKLRRYLIGSYSE